MSLTVKNVTKRFTARGTPAVADVSFVAPAGRHHHAARPVGLGQVDGAARGRRASSSPTAARCCSATRTSPALPAQKRGLGFVFQSYALFKHMNVRKNIAFGLGVRKVAEGRRRAQGRRAPVAGPARRPRRALPGAAVGRSAPAGGVRARARHRAQDAAARRAVRRARRAGARRAARLAAPRSTTSTT